jgi:hypothetical protein
VRLSGRRRSRIGALLIQCYAVACHGMAPNVRNLSRLPDRHRFATALTRQID